ncbi:MAG: pyridoxine 5'-phosphate synthase [Saprospiraceae bacterium]
MTSGIKLSVNINKVALIRNSREGNKPDIIQFARDCEAYGAEGITIHPRPDERHIRYSDIEALKNVVSTELNVEGNPTDHFMDEVLKNKPHQCTLVPDSPTALTSDKGWDTIVEHDFLKAIVSRLKEGGIRVSIFIDANPEMVAGASAVGADRVEFYTGNYAHQFLLNAEASIHHHVIAAQKANELGIGINAGHDLNLENLRFYATHIKGLQEVSIGHALVIDSLYYGLSNVIGMYKHQLKFFHKN